MKKNDVGLFVILFISIGGLFVINFGYSFGFLIGDNGEKITSTIVGDVIIDGSVTLENYSFFSDIDDVNAVKVIGGESTLINPNIDKSGNTFDENAFISGNNYAVFVKDNSILHINGGNIISNGEYAGGVVANNGMCTLDNVKIEANGMGSNGIMVSNGGEIVGNNLNILTNGSNSHAISSINGNISIYGGDYKTLGNNSSVIMAYNDVFVEGATLNSNKSIGILINGSANVSLINNKISNGDVFLSVEKNIDVGDISAKVVLDNQKDVVGNVIIDSSSKLSINIRNKSSYKGIINSNNDGNINLVLSKDSYITLMGDSYVSTFINEDNTNTNINFNGYHLYVNGKDINEIKISNDNNINSNKDSKNDNNKSNNTIVKEKEVKENIVVKEDSNSKIISNNDGNSIDASYNNSKVIHSEDDINIISNKSIISEKDLIIVNIIGVVLIAMSLLLIIKNKIIKANN